MLILMIIFITIMIIWEVCVLLLFTLGSESLIIMMGYPRDPREHPHIFFTAVFILPVSSYRIMLATVHSISLQYEVSVRTVYS